MESDRFFSQADLDAIQAAVREAEERTSGEIVPYVVERSDDYHNAIWKGAALGALLGPMAALALYRWSNLWGIPPGIWIALPAPLGGAAGYLLALLHPVRRWMTGEHTLDARARRRGDAHVLAPGEHERGRRGLHPRSPGDVLEGGTTQTHHGSVAPRLRVADLHF